MTKRKTQRLLIAFLITVLFLAACRVIIDDEARAPLQPTLEPEVLETLEAGTAFPAIVDPLRQYLTPTPILPTLTPTEEA
ncbi:MAG: hypothetical protein HC822_23145 [Oscillochloris sp.]|nr:hypothetical protein [Oscillochloris sp.]